MPAARAVAAARAVVGCAFDRTGAPLARCIAPQACVGEAAVTALVAAARAAHRRRFDLRKLAPGRLEEEPLWRAGDLSGSDPRFTLVIVDVAGPPPRLSHAGGSGVETVPCAVVLVPRGREREYMFASEEGLHQVAASANCRRLIAVRLGRGHAFEGGHDAVREELAPLLPTFGPWGDCARCAIPVLAVSDDLGRQGTPVAAGTLKRSGAYIVEDVEDDGRGGVFRQLVFMSSQGVVQTEVRLLAPHESNGGGGGCGGSTSSKKGGGGKGKKSRSKKAAAKGGRVAADDGGGSSRGGSGSGEDAAAVVGDSSPPDDEAVESVATMGVNSAYLSFPYHRCMVMAMAFAGRGQSPGCGKSSGGSSRGDEDRCLVIGLGGGALPMCLQRLLPRLRILACELDPEIVTLAKRWFAFAEGPNLRVAVADGLALCRSLAAAAVAAPAAAAKEAAAATTVAVAEASGTAPTAEGSDVPGGGAGGIGGAASDATASATSPGGAATCSNEESTTALEEGLQSDSKNDGDNGGGNGVSGADFAKALPAPPSKTGATTNGDAKPEPVSAPMLGEAPTDKVAPNCAADLPASPETAAAVDASETAAEAKAVAAAAAAEAVATGFGPPYAAVFIDVDSKDVTVGMSCPPAAFLASEFLAAVKATLCPDGVLAVNVAARARTAHMHAVAAVGAAFAGGEVVALKADDDDVNTVLLASPRRWASRPALAALVARRFGHVSSGALRATIDASDMVVDVIGTAAAVETRNEGAAAAAGTRQAGALGTKSAPGGRRRKR
ncbi:unnamed protein product [Phaeothamnion confervicola]